MFGFGFGFWTSVERLAFGAFDKMLLFDFVHQLEFGFQTLKTAKEDLEKL